MAAGLKALRKIQLGLETVPGTPVAATTRLLGQMKYDLDQKLYRAEDYDTGRLSSFERSIPVAISAKLPFEADANYEQLAYLLGMAIKGGVAGVGGSSLYTWTYLPNLSSLNAVNTYTIQYGDDIQAFVSAFCFAQGLDLSWALDDVVKVKAALVGQTVATTTFVGGLVFPATLNPVITNTGKLYIDTTWAGLGGTVKAATLLDGTWKITEGMIPIKYLDGFLWNSDKTEKKRHIELEATMAFNPNLTALWAAYTASPQTAIFVRIKFTGPVTGAGNMALQLEGCFTIEKLSPPFEDREGQNISKVKLVSQYDPVSGKEWQVVLTNAIGTLP